MNNNWLRKTLKDFAPYAVAPIHEKTVINANESYFNILSLPSVMKDAEEALASLKPQIYPAPMADTLREAIADYLPSIPPGSWQETAAMKSSLTLLIHSSTPRTSS